MAMKRVAAVAAHFGMAVLAGLWALSLDDRAMLFQKVPLVRNLQLMTAVAKRFLVAHRAALSRRGRGFNLASVQVEPGVRVRQLDPVTALAEIFRMARSAGLQVSSAVGNAPVFSVGCVPRAGESDRFNSLGSAHVALIAIRRGFYVVVAN